MSLAVGILTLYNAAFDLVVLVRDYKDFETDSSATIVRFNASKLKLEKWAETLGIRDGKLVDSHDSRLYDSRTALVVKNILRSIHQLFDKVEYKTKSLKLATGQRSAGVDELPVRLKDVRNEAEQHPAISKKDRIAWVMGGKSTLSKDVQNFEGLVNILYDVVGPYQHEATSRTESTLQNSL